MMPMSPQMMRMMVQSLQQKQGVAPQQQEYQPRLAAAMQSPQNAPSPQRLSGGEMPGALPQAQPTKPGGANNWFVQQLAARGTPGIGNVATGFQQSPVKQYQGMSSSYQMGQNGQPLLTYRPNTMSQYRSTGPT